MALDREGKWCVNAEQWQGVKQTLEKPLLNEALWHHNRSLAIAVLRGLGFKLTDVLKVLSPLPPDQETL